MCWSGSECLPPRRASASSRSLPTPPAKQLQAGSPEAAAAESSRGSRETRAKNAGGSATGRRTPRLAKFAHMRAGSPVEAPHLRGWRQHVGGCRRVPPRPSRSAGGGAASAHRRASRRGFGEGRPREAGTRGDKRRMAARRQGSHTPARHPIRGAARRSISLRRWSPPDRRRRERPYAGWRRQAGSKRGTVVSERKLAESSVRRRPSARRRGYCW